MKSGQLLLGVVVGLTAGAMLGVLFAPKKGAVTRRFIAQKGNNYVDEMKDRFNESLITVNHKIDSLKVADIYDLASYSGRRNANYIFDYFMNQYIAFNMPKGMDILGYLHYNPATKTFIFTEDEKLEVLPTK